MNRRKFINNSIKACASTMFLDGLVQKSFAQSYMLNAIAGTCTDNILVLVQLFGGNDGLNTIIPLDQYSLLSQANTAGGRSNLIIPQANLAFRDAAGVVTSKKTITTKYTSTAFHPAMEGMFDLFEASRLSIVQGCSYSNPDFSHFRATDIWMSGSDSNEFLKSGWIGRELEELYSPYGYPDVALLKTNGYPDPLAIQIGSNTSLAFDSSVGGTAISVTSISNDYQLLGGFGDPAPDTRAGVELAYLRGVAIDTDAYNARIVAAANVQKTNLNTDSTKANGYLANDSLSGDLKKISRLIKGGLKTRVYMVSLGGFDTHTQQVDTSDTTKGNHATLLNKVSKAIAGFQEDLRLMGVEDKVTGMVFSEFGRRVNSNGGAGSDHGAAMPVILFGSQLKGGMYGTNPNLQDPNSGTPKALGNVPMQFDYRSVYYSILKDWFCLSSSQLNTVFEGKTQTYHDLFKAGVATQNPEDRWLEERTNQLKVAYPNPMDETAIIPFNTGGGNVKLELYDMHGTQIRTLVDKDIPAGSHEVKLERKELKSGVYMIKMRNDSFEDTQKLILK